MNESRMLCFLVLVAAGCTSRDPGGSSSATNFLTCKIDRDCLSHAGAVRCDDDGFCLDRDGERIRVSAASDSMSGDERDAATPVTKPDVGSGGATAERDAGTVLDAGPVPTDAGAAADAGLQPIAQCSCNKSDVKTPITQFEATPSTQDANLLMVKFEDGSRVRLLDGKLGVDPAGRDAQDLAELDCAGLDFASADAALAEINALLAAESSVVVTPGFTLDPAALNDMRDFEGRHCAGRGGEALADLSNWYRWMIDPADGPKLLHALDANVLVSTAYYNSIPSDASP